jgi:DNA-binding NtrC family response regulator
MNIIKQGNLLFDKNIVAIDDEAMQVLKGRKWTGNVRELQNEIQRAMIKSETDSLSIEDFLSNLKEG